MYNFSRLVFFLVFLSVLVITQSAIGAFAQEQQLARGVDTLLNNLPEGSRIALAEFVDVDGSQSEVSAKAFQFLEPVVLKVGQKLGMGFVERKHIKLIIEEWKLNMVAITEGDAGANRLLDADYLLIGTVTSDGGRIRCNLKLSSINDGKIIGVVPLVWQEHHVIAGKIAGQTTNSAVQVQENNADESSDKRIRLWTDSQTYKVGDKLTVFFQVQKELYVKIYDVTPAGDVTVIFPNPYQTDNYCKPGITYQIPPQRGAFALEVTPPVGTDRLKAVASETPFVEKLPVKTRGIAFTRELVESATTRATISFRIQ